MGIDSKEIKGFRGKRGANGECVVTVIGFSGKSLGKLPLCLNIRKHSPTGFEWGYDGSGPAQLALAMCVAVLGKEIGSQPRVYQEFKRRVVNKLDHDGWEYLAEDVRQIPIFPSEAA